jgi:hypothetical protein
MTLPDPAARDAASDHHVAASVAHHREPPRLPPPPELIHRIRLRLTPKLAQHIDEATPE